MHVEQWPGSWKMTGLTFRPTHANRPFGPKVVNRPRVESPLGKSGWKLYAEPARQRCQKSVYEGGFESSHRLPMTRHSLRKDIYFCGRNAGSCTEKWWKHVLCRNGSERFEHRNLSSNGSIFLCTLKACHLGMFLLRRDEQITLSLASYFHRLIIYCLTFWNVLGTLFCH